MLIEKIIRDIGSELEFIRILNSEFIEKCHSTAFCWTTQPNSICLAMGKNYLSTAMVNPNIHGIVTSPKMIAKENIDVSKSIILLNHPDQFFYYLHNATLHNEFDHQAFVPFIDPSAQISSKAIVSQQVKIGAGTIIHDGAVILDNTIIGNDSIIYQNATIGTEGFFSKNVLGKKIHIEHFGGVKIGNNCLIHAASNVSRSVNFGEYTTIGNNSHIGIQSNVSHDCQIGENCDISAKVCFAGRVQIGNDVWVGAAATISNSVRIHDNAVIKIGSVVVADVNQSEVVSGNFAINHIKHLRKYLIKEDHANK